MGGYADETVRETSRAWVAGWDRLAPAWQAGVAQVLRLVATDGHPVPPHVLYRLDRIAGALQLTRATLQALAAASAAAAGRTAADIVAVTAGTEPHIIASQLPTSMAALAAQAYAGRIVPTALTEIVQRCTEQIHARHWPLTDLATESMRRALTLGMAVGDNPRTVGADMVRTLENEFNGGLARAINISRTELLDAYRDASQHVHEANQDVVSSWIWLSALGVRTCPGCWAMHGTEHPLSERGPDDHQSGRCARLAKARSWAELGLPFQEDDDFFPDRDAAWAALTRDEQMSVMGPGRMALLDEGRIGLSDLAARRENTAWRVSWAPMPIVDLRRIADQRPPR